jgi:hypothetical protein
MSLPSCCRAFHLWSLGESENRQRATATGCSPRPYVEPAAERISGIARRPVVTVAAVAVFLLVPYVNLRVDGQPATRPQVPRSLAAKFWRPLLDHSGPDDDEARWDTSSRRRRGKRGCPPLSASGARNRTAGDRNAVSGDGSPRSAGFVGTSNHHITSSAVRIRGDQLRPVGRADKEERGAGFLQPGPQVAEHPGRPAVCVGGPRMSTSPTQLRQPARKLGSPGRWKWQGAIARLADERAGTR